MFNICRICENFTNFTVNLSEASNFEGRTLLAILNECTQMFATLEDDLPKQICALCLSELELCYKFLLKTRKSDKSKQSAHTVLSTVKYEDDDASIVLNNDLETSIDPLEQSLQTVLVEPLIENPNYSECNENNNNFYNQDFDTPDNLLSATNAENLIFPIGQYQCNICSKRYFTAKGLKVHMDVHLQLNSNGKKSKSLGNQTKNQCKDSDKEESTADENAAGDCEKRSNEVAQLKPKTKQKKMYPCKICDKLMISASKLRYHMVMHTGEKDYLCTICPKAYSTIYALKYHMRTHTGERPYECKFCGDKFLRPTTLKSHMRRHTGERPYGCNICGKRFIQHSSMTTHIKLNHMAKTIPCPHCNKKYARKTDLSTHLLSHTGDKPFSCALCPSRFIRQANLNKHMNQHHVGNKSMNANKRMNKKSTSVAPTATTHESYNMNNLQDLKHWHMPHNDLQENIIY